MLGVVICQEARQCVERCKPGVAGSNAIAALFLDEGQEFGSGLGGEIVEVKLFNGPSGMLGDIAQEENDGVAIAADGVLTQATQCRQVVLEESDKGLAQVVRKVAFHDASPSIRWPKCASKHWLAISARAGIHFR